LFVVLFTTFFGTVYVREYLRSIVGTAILVESGA